MVRLLLIDAKYANNNQCVYMFKIISLCGHNHEYDIDSNKAHNKENIPAIETYE